MALSLEHESPLVLLREEPVLVPALLREALGLELPPFAAAALNDPDSTQPLPVPFRADLVVTLEGPERKPVMGVIVEIQRHRDEDKRGSWPLYAAALHARIRCQTCLVVIATDEDVARWAASPICTVQVGSPFAPLVIGPAQVPWVSLERAHREPVMAVLSALVHGNRPGGVRVAAAALTAIAGLPGARARFFADLIMASLDAAAQRALEDEMQSGKYEYRSEFARRYVGQGREEGDLRTARAILLGFLERRFGPVGDPLRRCIEACTDRERLVALVYEVADAPDHQTAERLIGALQSEPSAAPAP